MRPQMRIRRHDYSLSYSIRKAVLYFTVIIALLFWIELKQSLNVIIFSENDSVAVTNFRTQHIFPSSQTSTTVEKTHQSFPLKLMGSAQKKGGSQSKNLLYSNLFCEDFGGPTLAASQEMVYWKDTTTNLQRLNSNFLHKMNKDHITDIPNYLTFENDDAGWNNVRMGFETYIMMAIAMNRTLVLPSAHPSSMTFFSVSPQDTSGGKLYDKGSKTSHKIWTYDFFYDIKEMNKKLPIDIITMEEFLSSHVHRITPLPPPPKLQPQYNSVKQEIQQKPWDDKSSFADMSNMSKYLRRIGFTPEHWKPDSCILAFPQTGEKEFDADENMRQIFDSIIEEKDGRPFPRPHIFYQQPTPVNAPPIERLREALAERTNLCLYENEKYHDKKILHFKVSHHKGLRMLTHFYTFLFFYEWKKDLQMKRYARDVVRYSDEIFCAAGRVVQAIRRRAYERNPISNPSGLYDAFHIRRNDFQMQFRMTKGSAEDIYRNAQEYIKPGSTIYIATDEHDLSFFQHMSDKYDIVYLHDFIENELQGIDPIYYGMIDQLICARGRVFYGLFYSTFSGHVFRLRGYYSNKDEEMQDGDDEQLRNGGLQNSYYYIPKHNRNEMKEYRAVRKPFFLREYPVAWRDIEADLI